MVISRNSLKEYASELYGFFVVLIASVSLLIISNCDFESSEKRMEKVFIQRFTEAYEKGAKEEIIEMVNWDAVENAHRSFIEKSLTMYAGKNKVKSADLLSTKKIKQSEKMPGPNLPVSSSGDIRWNLEVEYLFVCVTESTDESSRTEVRWPVGKKNGKLFFVGFYSDESDSDKGDREEHKSSEGNYSDLDPAHVFDAHEKAVSSVAFSPDGKKILTGSDDGVVKLWSAKSGEVIRTLYRKQNRVLSVAISPDGKNVLAGLGNGEVKIWELGDGQLIRTIKAHPSFAITSVVFSPDGQKILSGSFDKKMKLWEVKSGELLRTYAGPDEEITSVEISPDGKKILSGSKGSTLTLWNLLTGEIIRTFKGHKDTVTSVSFSPNGQKVLSGSDDGTVRLWNVKSGEVIRKYEGPESWGISVTFSPDGEKILAGTFDGAKLWDLKKDTLIRVFEGRCGGSGRRVAFSPIGNGILFGCIDGTVKLYEVN